MNIINPLKLMTNCKFATTYITFYIQCLHACTFEIIYMSTDLQIYFNQMGRETFVPPHRDEKSVPLPNTVWLCRNLLQHQEINLPKAWQLLLEDWATGSEHYLKTALGNKKQRPYKTLLLVIFRLLTSRRHPCQDGHLGGRVYKSCRL